jgi:multidrug efflux pump subunit AcrB/outer membrane protein TolC
MASQNLVERAMIHWRIIVTLVLVLVGHGVLSFLTMPRQEFPEFTIRQGLVVGVMPGASSGEVEHRLTRPVEDYLFSFSEVDKRKTYSLSKEGQSIVFVELNDGIRGAEAPAFWAKLRLGLNELKNQKLPGQVVALVGNNDFGDTSAVLFTLVADGYNPRDLEKQLDVVEAHLRRIEATSKLRRFGMRKEVIRVTISRERLARYGIRPLTVWATLQGLGGAPAPARLEGDSLELPVRVSKVLRTENELGETILLSEPTGSHVRLKDVATLTREYGHDDAFIRFNGKTALVLSIEMRKGNDITRFGKEVDAALRQAQAELPPGVRITRVADQPKVVKASVGHFLRDFGLAILSVIAVTMLLLPLRVAAVAAVTIPICIFITLGILDALGIELQTVSLAGLIVVLGMVVDNAIVVIDDHVEKLDRGLEPWTAAWKSARELVVPVFTATLAIIMAYVPLTWFLVGTAGDFVGSLPATIAVALGSSLLLAAFLVPILNARFIRQGLHHPSAAGRPTLLDRLQRLYDGALERAFRHPWAVLGVGTASVVVATLMAAHLPQQLFPKVDRNQFAVEVYLPPGRPLKETDQVVRRLEKLLLADNRVLDVTSFVGESSPRFHTVYAPNLPGRNFAQLLVNTVDDASAVEVLRQNEVRYRGAFPEAWVRWKQLDMQATRAPIEVRLSGDDLGALKKLAARIEAHARELPGATWVRDDFEEPLQAIEVLPDADASARLGVSPAMLQLSLAMGLGSGLPVATLWEGDYPVSVLLAEDPRDASTVEGLRQQYVSSAFATATVPVEQLATIRPTWSEGALVRRNGVRTLTVRVDVGMDVVASDVQRELERFVASLGPIPGMRIDYGGEKEGTAENYGPMAASLAVSVAAIFLILLFQFQRHGKALLVMLTMPLSLLGAVLGLVATGYPFGFTAFLGVISLMGIVVRNGIILVGYAEELRRDHRLSAREAALAAGKRRMRPIYLTSVAAAIGVVPMILSRSTLWGPLGAVTCFGLILSMILTLFVLPVTYWLMSRHEDETPSEAASGPPLTERVGAGVAMVLLVGLCLPATARAQEHPLTLDECRALALRNNGEVRQAELEIAAAIETRKAAFTKYFPQVSAAGVVMGASAPLISLSTPGGNLPVYDGNPANLPAASTYAYLPAGQQRAAQTVVGGGLVAIQPVYAGGRVVNGNRLASLGVAIAQDKATLARREALAQTDEKYWRLVTLSEKRRTIAAYETLLAELERQATDAVNAGMATRNDLLKVTLQRRLVEVDRRRLENGIQLSARDLRRHIGLPEGDEVELADALSPPEDPAPLGEPRKGAVYRRVELGLLEKAVRAEHLQTAMKRGEMLPSVSVGAAAMGYNVSGLGHGINALAFGVLSVPLSGLWEGAHALRGQRLHEEAAEQRLSETRMRVALGIEKDWGELVVAFDAASATAAAVEQAEVNLDEAADRQRSGLVTLSDVLEAQVLRHQALDRRIEAWGDYWLERSAYLRSISQEDSAIHRP